MEHIFIGRSTGKFPTVTGKGDPVFLDGMLQTEIRVHGFAAVFHQM